MTVVLCVTELRLEYRVYIVQYIHVVAAVYVDQQRQNSRVANLFVSGLQPLPSVADATVVSDLCRSELGIFPDIVHCRRLGKMKPAHVQPLLVVLRSADQAHEIMANAKNLRKSTHSVIRNRHSMTHNHLLFSNCVATVGMLHRVVAAMVPIRRRMRLLSLDW